MLATILGSLGPVSDLTTGSDLPPWAQVNTWTVDRWRYVLNWHKDLFCETYWTHGRPVQSSVVRVPGLGQVLLFDLAPLIQRTTGKPPRRPGLIGWLAMVLHLEPAHVRRARMAWRIRVKVQALMVTDFHRSVVLHLEPADPFSLPNLPPTPNPPPPRNRPAPSE